MLRQTVLMVLVSLLSVMIVQAGDGECDMDCEDAASIFETYEPDVRSLTPDHDLMHDRWYQRINQRVQVYDAPHGNSLHVIEAGFNFVTVLAEQDGWAQINSGEWVPNSTLEEANWIVSPFTGVLLPPEGLDYPLAWALVNLYPSPEAGAEPRESLGYVSRYTRLTLFDSVEVDGYRWYQIGDGQWVHQFNVAKVVPLDTVPDSVDTDMWVTVNLYEQVVIAYEGSTPIFATLTSTGLPRWPTYEGTFHIYYRNPREYMSWGTVGDDFYALEEVPWTMFFDEGRALHGAYWHDGFGYRRSHGCVNLSITDAKWLYDWVAESMGSRRSADIEKGPAVYVYSTGQYDDD